MKKQMILFLTLLAAFFLFSASYTVPKSAYSVYAEDIDLDGDNDIVVGHLMNSNTNWTGITILENNNADFSTIDSVYIIGQHRTLCIEKINNNEEFDIITQYYDGVNSKIGILNDFFVLDLNDTLMYNVTEYADDIKTGDIDGDNDIDLVFISNNGSFWGYMKNDGTGQYDAPVYYALEERPSCIVCDDLNGDSIDDIVIGGNKLWVYLGKTVGFSPSTIEITGYISNVAISDINNDNKNEIIASNWGAPGTSKELLVFEEIDSTYTLVYNKWIDEALASFFFSDLNNDDYTDIVFNTSYSYPNSEYEETHTYILFNKLGTSFADPINYQTYSGTSGPTKSIKSFVADMDGSGSQDIVTVNYSYNDDNCINILFQDSLGNFVETSIDPDLSGVIENYELLQNYPNPFNNETIIDYAVKNMSDIEINIYNSNGQLVQKLVNSVVNAGMHSATFKADNLNSGIYYYRLKVNGNVEQTKKMLYLR
ncbi:MAG: T9SS type A sorting domain-containing protein [Candidatus Delongbacteria bacterium]|nr:T9SS type A sorting domain-containing protein [Candidatus Delongbacteria bacterium]